MMENYFTDQKWMDFCLPFPKLNINLLDLGFKCGPWNFEREIVNKDNFLLRIE
jgi:hypothetical protein